MWEEGRSVAGNPDVCLREETEDREVVFARILSQTLGPGKKEDILLAWASGTHDLGLRPILKASGLGLENIP